jgi:hypothetical protein
MAMADKKKAAAKEAGFAPTSNVPSWHSSPGTFIAGQEEVDDLDLVAIEMERKWGADRLRLLVQIELREKFDRQRYLVNQAIWHGELEDVRKECRRMVKAWRALDGAAEAAGATPAASGEVWECVGASGAVYALVRQAGDARHVRADGRHVRVYTLDEVAHLLDGFPALAKAKAIFPGAAVVKVRTNIGDPLDGLSSSREPLDDLIPF